MGRSEGSSFVGWIGFRFRFFLYVKALESVNSELLSGVVS